jgi:hypothetical protein
MTFAVILVSWLIAHTLRVVLTETEKNPLLCNDDAWPLALDQDADGCLLGLHILYPYF